jgi:DNA-directed RNA polymerase sigma subunit (sigma70/sigma32)
VKTPATFMRTCEYCGKRFPTAEERADIRKLADGLRTAQEIADATGVTYNHVYQQIRKEELAVRKMDQKVRNWERYLTAANERAAGKTLKQIGTLLGVGAERVRQMIFEVERLNGKIGRTK